MHCGVDRDGGGGTIATDGTPALGDITMSDHAQPSGWHAPIVSDRWQVALTAGDMTTVLVCRTSADRRFDPYVQVDFAGAEIGADNDSEGNLDPRFSFTAGSTGTFDVFVMAVGGTAPSVPAPYQIMVIAGPASMFHCSMPTGM
jgi:hypothetical protein